MASRRCGKRNYQIEAAAGALEGVQMDFPRVKIKATETEARIISEYRKGPDYYRRLVLSMIAGGLRAYSPDKDPAPEQLTHTVEADEMEQQLIKEYRGISDYGKLTVLETLFPRLHGEPPYTMNGKRLRRRSMWDMWEHDTEYEQQQAQAAQEIAGASTEQMAAEQLLPPGEQPGHDMAV